ncbi:hypothetical protein KUTeg_004314 [Tegillarca granosa]|uniref:Methyltransferase-like protein 22 n=1 Tax=Tegillarca granosa TaxID=220873 RepID=A0ABQ9FPP4_TEGGR|nr:hypothetical protein KUTeg_004314 [Tegillarca granosa]
MDASDGPDLYLSDVHIDSKYHTFIESNRSVSRFQFKLLKTEKKSTEHIISQAHSELTKAETNINNKTTKYTSLAVTSNLPESEIDSEGEIPRKRQKQEFEGTPVDEDGDLDVTRKNKVDEDTHMLTIEHSLATDLLNVGEQVWRGALILADYLIHTQSQLQDTVVLDLGSGTGLTSVIAALFCKKIYCTDNGENILKIAQHNLDSNIFTISDELKWNYVVRELDWFQDDLKAGTENFSFTEEEIEEIKSLCMMKTSLRPFSELFVFTVTDLDIVTPAYTHFRECLKDLLTLNDSCLQYSYSQIGTDFPQYFRYNRTKEMEIWKITSTFLDQ